MKDIIIDGMNGFIVPDGELKLFAETLIKAMNYPFNRYKIKKHIVDNFDANKIIKRYESFFLSVHNDNL